MKKYIVIILLCIVAATAVVKAQQVTSLVASNTSTNTAVSAYEPVSRSGGVMPAAYERTTPILQGTFRFSGMAPHNEEALSVCGVKDPTCWAFASTKITAKLQSTPFYFQGKMHFLNGVHLGADIDYYGGHNVPQKEYHAFSMGPLAIEKAWSVSYTLPKGLGEIGFMQHPPITMLHNFANSPTYHSSAEALGGRYNAFWMQKSFSIGGSRHTSQ